MSHPEPLGKFVTLKKTRGQLLVTQRKKAQPSRKVTRRSIAKMTFDQTRKHFGWWWDGVANQILIILMVLVEVVHTVMEK